MQDIRYRINVVALIAAVGALIALIGIILSINQFPSAVGWTYAIVPAVAFIMSLANIRPSINMSTAMTEVFLAVASLLIAVTVYILIADKTGAESFAAVGAGVWMAFAGSLIDLFFSISDLMYKKRQ